MKQDNDESESASEGSHNEELTLPLWVGIASSAGGLEALQQLLAQMDPAVQAIYIVAQHLSPRHDSMLVPLLQRSTRLGVEVIEDGQTPRAGLVYVTPPNCDVVIEAGRLHLRRPVARHSPKPSADVLFNSLAEWLGPRAVAVVMSGTGTDGAVGVRAVHAAGGTCVAQDPESARYDGMPRAALETGCVDLKLAPEHMASHLQRLATLLPASEPAEMPAAQADLAQMADLLQLVGQRTKVDLTQYKKATLRRRIKRRMVARGINELADYVTLARGDVGEVDLLFQDILISVTNFYRDPRAFDALAPHVREIVASKERSETIRVWDVGCATGEEAYTVAMMFAEALGGPEALADRNLQIFATDIDARALSHARKGQYLRTALESLPEAWRSRYFVQNGEFAQVVKPIRDVVLFSRHNVTVDPPFMRIDLVCCRNLLIYFEPDLQRRIYESFHYSLRQGGLLFLGKSESVLQATELFAVQEAPAKLFRKRASLLPAELTVRRHFGRPAPLPLSSTPDAARTGAPGGDPLFQSLATRVGTASILVNEALEVQLLYGDVTPFIRMRPGVARLNLSDIITDVHREEIRALVYKAARENTTTTGQPRNIRLDGQAARSQVVVYPLRIERNGAGALLVAFHRLPMGSSEATEDESAEAVHVRELEDELAAAREHLQTVIEELETSNEELQSLNEELQSSNEELQSSNEELETSNEELQSTNEELVTVNDELATKSAELEKLARHLSQVKNALDFPLLVVNADGWVSTVNDAGIEHFGIDEPSGNLSDLLPAQTLPAGVLEAHQRVVREGCVAEFNVDGTDRHYWLRLLPLAGTDAMPRAVIYAFLDITERRRVEQELVAARRDAERLSAEKTTFMAGVSHDVRTPLGTILNGIHILRRLNPNEEKRGAVLELVARAADQLNQLAEDFLTFARIEAGRVELVSHPVSLRELVTGVVDILRHKADGKGISLVCNVHSSVPDVVLADETKLRQVVLNLVGNAIKFTNYGGVTVTLEATPSQMGYATVRLQVSDSGIGIEAGMLTSVFDKFTQAHSGIARNYGGSGLGLTISRELTQMMGGSISVQSALGEGTTFDVRLPLRIGALSDGVAGGLDPGIVDPVFHTQREAEAFPILLVDDQLPTLTILATYLEYLGCVFELASSGFEAVARCERRRFGAVVMDLHMPHQDGFTAARALQASHASRNVPLPVLIAHSAHILNADDTRLAEAGFVHFLPKPISLRRLRDAIAEAVSAARP